MKTDLVKRVERMESRVNLSAGVSAVFITYVSPGHIDRPVRGWIFGHRHKRTEVLRNQGESDEALKRRAITLAREYLDEGNVPTLTSIG